MSNHQPDELKPSAGGNRKLRLACWIVSACCLLASVIFPDYVATPEMSAGLVEEFVRSFRILAAATLAIGLVT